MFADASISDTAGVIFAVLAASLLGSLHCAGMCGGLVLFAVGSDGTFKRRARLHVAYHGGRGLAYIALGIFAGLLGATADLAITSGDGIRTSAIVAGLGMITLGLITLAPSIGLRGVRARLPAPIRALIDGIHGWAFRLPPTARAASVGILTPMLPCGWLYAFVIVAAGTGSMIFGGVVMAAFWFGTLPVMGMLGFGLQKLTGPLRSRLPIVTSSIVIALGLATAFGRVGVTDMLPQNLADGSAGDRVQSVRTLSHEGFMCCPPFVRTLTGFIADNAARPDNQAGGL